MLKVAIKINSLRLFAVGLVVFLSLLVIGHFFIIGFPSPYSTCLHDKFFIVSIFEKEVKRGELGVIVIDRTLAKHIPAGSKLIKRIVGFEGDKVEIKEDGVLVNNEYFYPVPLKPITIKMKKNVRDFIRVLTVPKDEVFVIGETDNSYDSRYWGTVKKNLITNRAYGLI